MIAHALRPVRPSLLIVSIMLGLGACASQPATHESAAVRQEPARLSTAPVTVGERAAAVALRQVGVPYRFGGSSPAGFDCSGLVHYSYASAGLAIPRTTAALWARMAPVDARSMRTGDLLFFDIQGKMSHVGIYVGDERFVHAPSTGKRVSVDSLDAEFYRRALIRGGRVR